MSSFGDPKWSHSGTRNGPVWGPEMIVFEDSELTHLGTDLETEDRDWDRNEFVFGRSKHEMRLRKLALVPSELELLRSHPKDERGSVREIGLWIRMCPTLHFLELSPTLSWEFAHSSKWSFSGRVGSPEMDSFGDPKWLHLGTRNGIIWGSKMIPFEDSELIHFGTDLGTENRDWDRNEFVFGRSNEM